MKFEEIENKSGILLFFARGLRHIFRPQVRVASGQSAETNPGREAYILRARNMAYYYYYRTLQPFESYCLWLWIYPQEDGLCITPPSEPQTVSPIIGWPQTFIEFNGFIIHD